MSIRALAAVALAAVSTLAAVGPAIAGQPGYTSRSVAVSTADLNLSSRQGVEQLQARVRSAVRQVCGSADPMDLSGRASVQACREQAIESARPKVAAVIAAANTRTDLAMVSN